MDFYPQHPSSAVSSILSQLMAVVMERKASPPSKSYTSQLLQAGPVKIGEKVREEADEAAEAALEAGDAGAQHLVREAADVVYHLLVLLASRDVTLADVEAELGRRFGVSGIDEKASRTS